jgi:hypothetical protein
MKVSPSLFNRLRLPVLVCIFIIQRRVYLQPEDMPDAEDFDKEDTWEEGLTELDRQRHGSKEDDLDLMEDEDGSFADEAGEEE